jgi:copper chaperone CopZ
MRSALSLFCAALVVVIASTGVRADDDIVVVKVQGQGIDKDGALKDALRHAIEQGGQQEIASKSKTQDFQLEYDVILSRASGLVKHFDILSENSAQGITTVQISAQVSKKLMDATWADVAILLKQLGRPKIMIIFTELIHDLDRPESSREIVQRDSILGTAIERKLLKLGFKLVNPGQMKEVDKKKAEAAALEDNAGALKAIAASYGAQIYIKGTSRATGPQHTNAAGIELNMWETDVTIQGFWTETADSIFSNTMTGVRGGSRVAGPIGGRQALEKSGVKLADASVYDLLESWTRGTAGGVGDVIVEVHNVADIKQRVAIKKALAEVKGVEEVTVDGVKGTVKFTIQTNMTGEQFVDFMAEMKFDGFTLDVEDAKSRTITCKVK